MAIDRWILHNGEFRPAGDVLLAADARTVMYGDGCFETMRCYEGELLHFKDHIKRLEAGLEYLNIYKPNSLGVNDLRKHIIELLNRNGLSGEQAVVRLQVWREGGRGYMPDGDAGAGYVMSCGPLPGSASALELATAATRRIPSSSLSSRFKLSGGTNYIKAASEAGRAGADDALMLTTEGNVSETTVANIFWVRDEHVYTPSEECDLLPGITRGILLDLLRDMNHVQISEGSYEPAELQAAEAAWVCNSLREIQPVARLDEVKYRESHPVIYRLKESFRRYVESNLEPLQP